MRTLITALVIGMSTVAYASESDRTFIEEAFPAEKAVKVPTGKDVPGVAEYELVDGKVVQADPTTSWKVKVFVPEGGNGAE